MAINDRRASFRKQAQVRVVMENAAIGVITGFAENMSDGGAAVCIERQSLPPIGTELRVLFERVQGRVNQEPVLMRVIYARQNMLGLAFVDNKS